MRDRLATELCAFGRRLAERGFIVATDGNLSCRLPDGTFLVTPSGVPKGDLAPSDLLRIDRTGRPLEGGGTPTSERYMHLAVYEERPDVQAVIHAHPPAAVALTVAGLGIDATLLPEVVIDLGQIPTVPYRPPTTREAAEAIRPVIRTHDALILARHGSLTVGGGLTEAFHALERLEHAAWIQILALAAGSPRPLPPDEIARLAAIREARRAPTTAQAGGSAAPSPFPRPVPPWH